MNTPQPNEAPVEVCQEAKDAAKTINNLRSERTWDDIWNPIHHACLAYAQRKVEERDKQWQMWVEVATRNPNVFSYMRHCEGRATEAESQLTAAQQSISELTQTQHELMVAQDEKRKSLEFATALAARLEITRAALGALVDAVNGEFPGGMNIGGNTGLALIDAVNILASTANHERKP